MRTYTKKEIDVIFLLKKEKKLWLNMFTLTQNEKKKRGLTNFEKEDDIPDGK